MRSYRLKKRDTPGKIIVVMNHKGGSAKSTSVQMLATVQAKASGVSPLVVDFDSQMNASAAFRHRAADFKGNIGGVLHQGEGEWTPSQVVNHICAIKLKGVGTPAHLIPGSMRLAEPLASLDVAWRRDEDVVLRLRQALHYVRDYYEYMFVDTSPAVSALSGDLALYAADVLMVPVGCLRSVLGLVEVLRRMKSHIRHRLLLGLAPPKVLIYAPHVLSDRRAAPYGEFGVQNADWYPLLCEVFPKHFVKQVVGHSIYLPRSFKKDNALSALKGDRRAEYLAMGERIFELIEDRDLPSLGAQLSAGFLDQLQDRVDNMIRTDDLRHTILSVQFQDIEGAAGE